MWSGWPVGSRWTHTTEPPPTSSAGARLAGVDVPHHVWWRRGQDPFRRSLRGAAAGRPSPPARPFWPFRRRVHHTSRLGRRLPTATPKSRRSCVRGAAGSRTRVPRSRRCGLYVRRSWIISDAVLLDQTAPAFHTVSVVPAALDGPSQRVEPGDVDPHPLPGVGGGSSQVFRLRGPAHRWHVEVPDVGLSRSRQAPSARSHDDGMTTVETVSAPSGGSHRRSAVVNVRRAVAAPGRPSYDTVSRGCSDGVTVRRPPGRHRPNVR
jgi:hypothetical protein